MNADTTKALEATKQLVAAVPFLGGSSSERDYHDALALVDYLIEHDDENPLIDLLASKIADYEDNSGRFAEFDAAIAEIPVGVALLRTLIDQHKLTYADLKDEIGSKSLVSQILSGQRSLTISHIKALSTRFGVKPEWFLN
ncbi:helix-turn-helix domain-containing protein [Metakosakonia massiliensis]|uniref:Antitoxin HigA n=1 Tax=Phytobacter massiliensis TaxID=1485952 RepID=A0A6N3DSU1_9ENTR|nr:helix-turn-helix domain-containing protein [Phytobacter massiliensis]